MTRPEPPGAADDETAASAARLLHDLRNRLGSLLLNAEVLIARLPEGERESASARHLVADGRRCAALIMQLEESLKQR
ncbi:hypothetical protein [Arenimonas composti]|uniref:Signal transduction histidine kinase dimerisation/phosphoacceptor domain-containing protein n=1 Tax=Arenimonas composti TR7-09 = DSM 18010 TaxID=1121013 RepID=A0A091C0K7_9GAMM|nr:hypothetical protein [Arenimonas composti]KFN50165.1 hypothetical protein P873_07970 [Arenimonas composti TR7-09 = DSM 18010]